MTTDIEHYESITRALLSESRIVSTFSIDHTADPPCIIVRVSFTIEAPQSQGTYLFRSTDTHEDSIREFGRMLQEVLPHGASIYDKRSRRTPSKRVTLNT